MKTLNLFLKMHFTSLSPDGQPVSLAIVTEGIAPVDDPNLYPAHDGNSYISVSDYKSKSFYAEFSDYDINRCDDWVKENVLSKLQFSDKEHIINSGSNGWKSNPCYVHSGTKQIKEMLTCWITQFSDYKLNFIVDCGWFAWYKFVELMAEWDEFDYKANGIAYIDNVKTGLPKLPANFPPVPIDLNDLIMERKGFKSVADAFNVDREVLAFGRPELSEKERFSALFDAKVTKAIYEKLK